jgi:hypothetical protein
MEEIIMKKYLMLKVLAIIVIPALPFAPVILNPTITFYEDGKAPVISGRPEVCNPVGIYFVGSSSGSSVQKTISDLKISGDSLLIYTTVDPSPGSNNTVIFDSMGIYKAYEIDMTRSASFLGTVRILPIIKTDPAMPIRGTAIQLSLTIAQQYSDCTPLFNTKATVSGNKILLDFQAYLPLWLRPCVISQTPIPYGPVFNLGTLAPGEYSLVIEDSVTIGTLTVNDILILKGMVTIMQSPYIRMMARPVADAVVTAVKAVQCPDWWNPNPAPPETLKTVTDNAGAFTLNLPYTNDDFEITVFKKGFHLQTLYTSNYPVAESYPPQQHVSFELLQDTIEPVTGLEVTVTLNGHPAESVYVSLTGGREPLMCPMYLAKAQAVTNAGGYTDAKGIINFRDLSMTPYIDYAYSAYRYTGSQSYSKTGIIRLNKYIENKLTIELGKTALLRADVTAESPEIMVNPNPFHTSTLIEVKGKVNKIQIYNVSGRLIKQFTSVRSGRLLWNAQDLSSGIYIVKAVMDKKHLIQRLILLP